VIGRWGLRPPRTPRTPPAIAILTIAAIFLFGACTEAPLKVAPSGDAEAGAKLARDAGALLLQFAAYDRHPRALRRRRARRGEHDLRV